MVPSTELAVVGALLLGITFALQGADRGPLMAVSPAWSLILGSLPSLTAAAGAFLGGLGGSWLLRLWIGHRSRVPGAAPPAPAHVLLAASPTLLISWVWELVQTRTTGGFYVEDPNDYVGILLGLAVGLGHYKWVLLRHRRRRDGGG